MDYSLNFSNSLLHYLSINKINQKDLSFILNIKQSTLSMWLNHKSTPTLNTINYICKTLNISIYQLLGYDYNINSDFEKTLINAYNQHPEHQISINKLLDIEVKK